MAFSTRRTPQPPPTNPIVARVERQFLAQADRHTRMIVGFWIAAEVWILVVLSILGVLVTFALTGLGESWTACLVAAAMCCFGMFQAHRVQVFMEGHDAYHAKEADRFRRMAWAARLATSESLIEALNNPEKI